MNFNIKKCLVLVAFSLLQMAIKAQEETIILHTSTGDLDGTLAMPEAKNNIPVVLIIAGSGPTDRNGNNSAMENNSLKFLADGLRKNGIASVRFDKRGVAGSQEAMTKESDYRIENLMDDVKDWIKLLAADKRFGKLFVAGHSEGSLIGMVAAENNKSVSGFISIAGAGRSADLILKEQFAETPKNIKEIIFPMIDTLKKGDTISSVPHFFHSLFRPSVQPYLISWFKYNPQDELKKLDMPILIIQGTNDLQVKVEDANLLAKANPKATLVLIEKMNHVFKIVEGDKKANKDTYDNADLPIADRLTESMVKFINN